MAQRSTGFWGHRRFAAIAASAVAALGGCSSREVRQERDAGFAVEGSDVDWAVHESELGMRGGHPYSRATYYRVRPTLGVCDEPGQCGAYRVQALPRRPLRCADGSIATECPAELIRSPTAWPGGEEYVVRGRLLSETNAYNQTQSVIDADVVWSTMFYEPEDSEGMAYYSVSKPERRCLREPCPAARVRRVGVPHARAVFEIDWQTAECPEVRAAEALGQMELGEIIVAGKLEHKRPFAAERLSVFQVLVTELPTYCAPQDAGPQRRTCFSDPDCEYEEWCRETRSGERECVPFKSNGQQCFWSPDEPWREERCQIGEQWCEPYSTPDAPGICRTACKGMCPMNEYCTPYGCNGTGTCLSAADCMRDDNPWTHAGCTGYPTCEKDGETFGQCTWQCGEPACMDLSNRDLGTCEQFMGYGVYGGECRILMGCEGAPVYDVPSFSTLEECQATCNVQMP